MSTVCSTKCLCLRLWDDILACVVEDWQQHRMTTCSAKSWRVFRTSYHDNKLMASCVLPAGPCITTSYKLSRKAPSLLSAQSRPCKFIFVFFVGSALVRTYCCGPVFCCLTTATARWEAKDAHWFLSVSSQTSPRQALSLWFSNSRNQRSGNTTRCKSSPDMSVSHEVERRGLKIFITFPSAARARQTCRANSIVTVPANPIVRVLSHTGFLLQSIHCEHSTQLFEIQVHSRALLAQRDSRHSASGCAMNESVWFIGGGEALRQVS